MTVSDPPNGAGEQIDSDFDDGWRDLPLDAAHIGMLKASGISPAVAKARGYETLTTKAAITKRGFGDRQAIPPGLLIPQHTPAGVLDSYLLRPDQPRQLNGKIVKYEWPRNARPGLDANPLAVKWIMNPDVALWATEGSKKADAATSHELACVSVPGVTMWHTNDAIASWNLIPLNGRMVYLAFDSDASRKRAVRTQLVKLAEMLRQRGADVLFVMLPDLPSGKKQGLDDWFGAGGTTLALQRLATSDEPPEIAPDDDDESRSGFSVREGRICWAKPAPGGGAVWIPLAEFDARIVEERAVETGADRRREYAIAGALPNGSPLATVSVSARDFPGMSWVNREWGPRAIVAAGMGTADRLREAIQRLSDDFATRTIYEQPGWWKLSGHGWCYLHAGGGIGAEGSVPGIEVRLSEAAAFVRLPDPPEGAALADGVRAVLGMLDIAPDRVMVPAIAAALRAPLCVALPADFADFLFGPSGVLKSELGALVMRCFGPTFDRTRLPAQWSATANALERLAFLFNDLPLVIDDFAPSGPPREVDRLHATADRVIRGAGNLGGRARMNADGSLRPTYRPEGVIVATGEDLPRGHSLRARLVGVEVAKGDVDPVRLAAYQREPLRSRPSHAMAGYLRWLAPRIDALTRLLPERLASLRDEFATKSGHLRTPEAMANLALGWRVFLDFAAECGAITGTEADQYWGRVVAALRALDRAQASQQRTEEPAAAFLAALVSALSAGKAHVAGANGEPPEIPHAWGWRERVVTGAIGDSREWQPGGARVGWLSGGELFLDPGAAHQAVGAFDPKAVALTQTSLAKRLNEGGFLASTDVKRETLKVRKVLSGQRRDVLHLAAHALSCAFSDQPDHKPTSTTDSGAIARSGGMDEPDQPRDSLHVNGRVVPFDGSVRSAAAPQPDHDGDGKEADATDHFATNGRAGRVSPSDEPDDVWEDVAV